MTVRPRPSALCLMLLLAGGCASSQATTPPAEEPAAMGDAEVASDPPLDPADDAVDDEETGWAGEADAVEDAEALADGPEPERVPKGAEGKAETRTMSVIQKIIVDNRARVRACYDRALKDNPELRGDMTIHFVLDPEGKVKKAELNLERSTLKAPDVVACAIEEIRRMPFPASSRGMETGVNYPFNFTH